MADIISLISPKDWVDFSQQLSVQRNYVGDTLFPDSKTDNLEIEYMRLTDGLNLPTIAPVHAFDSEAVIASRQGLEKVKLEKLLIKEKINQTERVQLFLKNGASQSRIVDYIFDDAARLAEAVKTRTEAAKMEALTSGKMTVKENNLDFEVDYQVPEDNQKEYTWNTEEVDILKDIQEMVDIAGDKGKKPNTAITSRKVMAELRENKFIQTAINGTVGVGRYLSDGEINRLLGDMFGINIIVDDEKYQTEDAKGKRTTARFVDDKKFVLCETGSNGAVGAGLWGVTPEEASYGPWTAKSQNQYITITQWQTPDPVAVWTKASGVFIPVLPDPNAVVIGTITLSE